MARGIATFVSASTVRRWLAQDALKPWQHRSWIFITDPDLRAKAQRVLDLYARTWQSQPLGEDEYVISADEKTSIQARCRCYRTPVHASWLNQVEIYFSVVQRKVVSPNDFADLTEVADRLRALGIGYSGADVVASVELPARGSDMSLLDGGEYSSGRVGESERGNVLLRRQAAQATTSMVQRLCA